MSLWRPIAPPMSGSLLPIIRARSTKRSIDSYSPYETMPKNGWAHFHCEAGRGRTTMFMVLYDMLRNANRVSLEDIARRQQLLGYDYDVLRPADPGDWKAPYTDDRIAFVRAFYNYSRSNPSGRTAALVRVVKIKSELTVAREISRMEARGVEPLSSPFSTRTSTCLSDAGF